MFAPMNKSSSNPYVVSEVENPQSTELFWPSETFILWAKTFRLWFSKFQDSDIYY